MINVGSYYITSENIKSIHYEQPCMVITYFFENVPVRIPVGDYEQYKEYAETMRKTLRKMKAEDNANNNN